MNDLRKETGRIRTKYQSFKECDDILDKFHMSANSDFISYKTPLTFNLIEAISRDGEYDWFNEIIASNIPYNTRLEMLADILKFNDKTLDIILKNDGLLFSTIPEDTVKSRKQELLKSFNNGECSSYNVKQLFLDLLDKDRTYIIKVLQDEFFDFNALHFELFLDDIFPRNLKTSAVSVLCNKFGRIESFEKLYKSDSYLKNNQDICDNDTFYILKTLYKEELAKFIELSNSEINQIGVLIDRVNESIDFEPSIGKTKYRKNLRQNIANALLHKARNKEEYRKYFLYTKAFLEKTDINAEEKKQLQEKRKELTTILYKMNNEALESVPARKLVKDIEFKQEA
jgi:hypothetical protein